MLLHAGSETTLVNDYLARVEGQLRDLPAEDVSHLISYSRALIEVELELASPNLVGDDRVRDVLDRLGTPESMAGRAREQLRQEDHDATEEEMTPPALVPCRTCSKSISREAFACPHCGAPFPARKLAPVSGYEWKSKARLFGLPLVHVAFGRDKNGKMRVAKGIIAIGQFGIGAITIAQFGVGALFGLGQFVAAPICVAQFALGLVAIGQFGIGAIYGLGQFSTGIWHKDMFSLMRGK